MVIEIRNYLVGLIVSAIGLALLSATVFAQTLEIDVDKIQCERKRVYLSCQGKDSSISQVSTANTTDGKCYFIGPGKKPINSATYDVCFNHFREGAAYVCLTIKAKSKCGLVKLSGEYLVPPVYDDIRTPRESMIAVKLAGKWGFIDLQKNVVAPIQYEAVKDFHEGLAQVQMTNENFKSKTGFIDKQGRHVFTLADDLVSLGYFQNGLLAVRKNEKWGYIDNKAKFVIVPQYSLAKSFYAGYAAVRLNELKTGLYRWALINKNNEKVHLYTGEIQGVDYENSNAVLIYFSCDKKQDDNGDWNCSYGCLGMNGKLAEPVCGTMSTNKLPFR